MSLKPPQIFFQCRSSPFRRQYSKRLREHTGLSRIQRRRTGLGSTGTSSGRGRHGDAGEGGRGAQRAGSEAARTAALREAPRRASQARCKWQELHLHGVMSLVLKPSTVIFLPCTGVRASVRETVRGSMWVHRHPGCLSGAQDRSHPQVLHRLYGVGFLPKEYTLVSFVHMTIILSILTRRGIFQEGRNKDDDWHGVRAGRRHLWILLPGTILMKPRSVLRLAWLENLEGIGDTRSVREKRGRRKCLGRVGLGNARGHDSAQHCRLAGSPGLLSSQCLCTIRSSQNLRGQGLGVGPIFSTNPTTLSWQF